MSGHYVHGHDAEQDRPGAPRTVRNEGVGPAEAEGFGHASHGATGQPAGAHFVAATDDAGLTIATGHDDAAARRPADLTDGPDDLSTEDHGRETPVEHPPTGQRRLAEGGEAPSAGARRQDDAASVVPYAQALGQTEPLTLVTMCSGEDVSRGSTSALPPADGTDSEATAHDMLPEHDRASSRTPAWPLHDGTEVTGAPAATSPLGATDPAVAPGHDTDRFASAQAVAQLPPATRPGDPALPPPHTDNEAADTLVTMPSRDAADPDSPAFRQPYANDAADTGLAATPLQGASEPDNPALLATYAKDAAATSLAATPPRTARELDAPALQPSHANGAAIPALTAAPPPDAAEPSGPAVSRSHDERGIAMLPPSSRHVADPDGSARPQHDGEHEGVAERQDAAEADGSASTAHGEDEVTTILVAASPQRPAEPGGHASPTPHDEEVTASPPHAAGSDTTHTPPYEEDEVTTVVVIASSPHAAGPDPAHTLPYEADEVTTVVVTASSPHAAGSNPAPTLPYEADEVTTVVVTASIPDVAGPDSPAHLPRYDEDEVTTVLVAAPGKAAAGLPGRAETSHDDEEVTTVLVAAGPGAGGPSGMPPAEPGRSAGLTADPEHSDDEPTTIVASAEPDERTRLVQAEPALPSVTPDAADPYAPDHLSAAGQTYSTAAHQAGSAAAAPAAHAEDPVTEVIQVPRPPGTAASDPDRHWFDVAFSQFMTALRQDEAGRPRPQEERHALAAAARDTITRVAMQTVRSGEGWATDTVLQPDQLLANTYTVRSLIARGGIGEIYRVRHRDLKTEHAIKILLPQYALDATMQTLMLDEARLLRRVQHEAVVRAQDLLRDADGRPMLVMDYIRGRTLASRLRESELSAPELLALTRRLTDGLSAIHATGIVHQDISPDNIILAEDSCATATIIDFGLARVVGAGRDTHRNLDFAGKYSWSSPEQLSGRPAAVDARSDLYSLGLILAAATRGYRLEMGNDLESARAARRTVPSLSGVEEPMRGLLARLLAPAPEARLASASEIHGMLETKRVSWWRGWLGM